MNRAHCYCWRPYCLERRDQASRKERETIKSRTLALDAGFQTVEEIVGEGQTEGTHEAGGALQRVSCEHGVGLTVGSVVGNKRPTHPLQLVSLT